MAQSRLRVLVIVSQRSPLLSKARESPQDLILPALRVLKKNQLIQEPILPSQTRLLAGQNWRTRTFLVFDIANTDYDVMLGHLPEHNQLPVVVAHFSKTKTAYMANAVISRRVNHDVGMLHNANGFDALPPYIEDHTSGNPPAYQNPRDISMLRVIWIKQ
ncbi:uncharacterized protein N7469_003140 [Penicillium citrinum]|uniref:Uncharacterized protein n=1 Tax=Penicillium citrinum TaxID=5077 RepID=A0A9W9PBM7_PENCI|nr:uncharacterized protein N7469_003140 [Penicillium citrinum]KAJ5241549.1 hypothetical protein N7469_003140 [Penicillium citrinum]